MDNELLKKITESVIDTDEGDSAALAREALSQGIDPLDIVDALTEGINELGRRFDELECFLPELIMGGTAMEEAMEILLPEIEKLARKTENPVRIVVGNLQGDIHDIGREILCTMFRVAGFKVLNLGNDVKADVFVEKAVEFDADIICLSSLLTTSLPFSKDVLKLLETMNLRDRFKVMMGGGAVTEKYVEKIGADAYTDTAMDAVEYIKAMYLEVK